MANNTTLPPSPPPLPNPFTPLAFLPPEIAGQFQAAVYLYVATLAAFIWDWLMSIPEEIKMCRARKFRPPTAVYFFSRIGALGFCTLSVVFQTSSVAHCNQVINGISGFFILAVSSTSALFFFRVRAIYCQHILATSIFGFLCFAISALSFTVSTSVKGAHIGTTQRCTIISVTPYSSASIIATCLFDTLVFIAISVRIVSYSIVGDTFGARMKSFFRGDGLPGLSRSLLHGGQLYYFATIGLSIVVVVMVLVPSVPPTYHAMFTIPNIALASAMACRVFRGVRTGIIKDNNNSIALSTLHFSQKTFQMAPNVNTMSMGVDSTLNFETSRHGNAPLAIKITKSMEVDGSEHHHLRRQDSREDKKVGFDQV